MPRQVARREFSTAACTSGTAVARSEDPVSAALPANSTLVSYQRRTAPRIRRKWCSVEQCEAVSRFWMTVNVGQAVWSQNLTTPSFTTPSFTTPSSHDTIFLNTPSSRVTIFLSAFLDSTELYGTGHPFMAHCPSPRGQIQPRFLLSRKTPRNSAIAFHQVL